MALLKRCYENLVFYGGLALFGLLALGLSLVALPLRLLLPRDLHAPLGRGAIAVLSAGFLNTLRFTGLVQIDLAELETLRTERGLVIAPNHPSMIDMVLICSRLPRVACIMRAGLCAHPLLGGAARLADYIRNAPSVSMVRDAVAALKKGEPLLIFPEGTRSEDGVLNPFKGGFALIAKQAGVPVQTVFIETNSRFLGKGWPLLKKPDFPLIYRACLGERFEVNGDVKSFVGQMEAYYQRTLTAQSTTPQAKFVSNQNRASAHPSPSTPTLPAS